MNPRILPLILVALLSVGISHAQVFDWAASYRGTSFVRGSDIASGPDGSVITIGSFSSTADFNPSTAVFNLSTGSGFYDAFLVKLTASGGFVWGHQFGGSGHDIGRAARISRTGQVYSTGHYRGTVDFDPGSGTYNLNNGGEEDVYISKLDASGNFVWAHRFSGPGRERPQAMFLDDSSNVYVIGIFEDSTDFDPGSGTFYLASNGSWDVFVTKLDSNGQFLWAKSWGNNSNDNVFDISVDASGNVYTTGEFYGQVDFDPSSAVFNLVSSLEDVFVSKLNANGDFEWTKSMGGSADDRGSGVHADTAGNVWVCGMYEQTADFDPGSGTYNLVSQGSIDGFVCKLDSNGDFQAAASMGGSGLDWALDLETDDWGNLFVTGRFSDTADFDPGNGAFALISNGDEDVFMAKLDANLLFQWAGSWGSNNDDDEPKRLHVSASNSVYSIGEFYSTVDFNTGAGTFNQTSAGNMDTYIHKMGPCTSISYDTVSITTCDSLSSPSGQYTWSQSGTYADTLLNSVGCDSVVTVNLTVYQTTYDNFSTTACDSFISPSGTYQWIASGTYLDTVQNTNGCDSVISIDLTVLQSTYATLTEAACDSFTSPSGNYQWTTSGTYHDTLVNAAGCDSIITVSLTVNYSTIANVTAEACRSYLSPSGNHTWTVSGNYQDTIATAAGCDSVLNIQLIVTHIDTALELDVWQLSSTPDANSYQWIDCADNSIIDDATDSVFTPDVSGYYAVVLEQSGCTDTSECYQVIIESIAKRSLENGIDLFPNPTQDAVMITAKSVLHDASVYLVTPLGERVLIAPHWNGTSLEFDLRSMPSGLYLVAFDINHTLIYKRLIKH